MCSDLETLNAEDPILSVMHGEEEAIGMQLAPAFPGVSKACEKLESARKTLCGALTGASNPACGLLDQASRAGDCSRSRDMGQQAPDDAAEEDAPSTHEVSPGARKQSDEIKRGSDVDSASNAADAVAGTKEHCQVSCAVCSF